MSSVRQRRLIFRGERGSTLVELLVAMPIAIALLGIVVQALGQAGRDQQDLERRTEAVNQGQLGLERLTRELRQATWVAFRSSAVVDLNVRVRTSAAADSTPRLVRWDCSGNTCVRSEGAPVGYPPPASPSFTESEVVIGEEPTNASSAINAGERQGQVIDHDVFTPMHVDPATGQTSVTYGNPPIDYVRIRLHLAVRNRAEGAVELNDGASLRNATTYKR